ncbi:MAG: DNA repair protein (RadC) [Leptospirillum sp. Group IV 'UBA BS']|nr:MAG: DNA repair protein (RadC) [Leptospirillum sp. Group IV 'UBA BS']
MSRGPLLPGLSLFQSETLRANSLRDEPDWALVERITGKKCPENVNLRTLSRMTEAELSRTLGLSDTQGKKLGSALVLAERLAHEGIERGDMIKSGADVYRIFAGQAKDAKKEGFYAVTVDQKHQAIDIHRISEGTLSMTPVHPREAFNPVIRDSAAAVIFIHNHPSGNPEPSNDDHLLTVRLSEVGKLMGIRVLDHVVIGDGDFVSLRDRGAFREENGMSQAAESYGCRESRKIQDFGRRAEAIPNKTTRTFLIAPREKAEGGPEPDYSGLVVIGKKTHKIDFWKDGRIQIARSDPGRFTSVGNGRLSPPRPGELAGSVPVQTGPDGKTSVELGIRGVGNGTPVRLSVSEGRTEKVLHKNHHNERGIGR